VQSKYQLNDKINKFFDSLSMIVSAILKEGQDKDRSIPHSMPQRSRECSRAPRPGSFSTQLFSTKTTPLF